MKLFNSDGKINYLLLVQLIVVIIVIVLSYRGVI